jgi:hypothetical protein
VAFKIIFNIISVTWYFDLRCMNVKQNHTAEMLKVNYLGALYIFAFLKDSVILGRLRRVDLYIITHVSKNQRG